MKKPAMEWSVLKRVLCYLWGLEAALLVCSRQLATWNLFLILIVVLIVWQLNDKPFIRWRKSDLSYLLPFGLFVLYTIDALENYDHPNALLELEKKGALLAIPVLWIGSRISVKRVSPLIYVGFLIGVFGSAMIMLIGSFIKFLNGAGLNAFFYNELTNEIGISPIYFSFFAAIILAWPRKDFYTSQFEGRSQLWIRSFAFGMILLSASKLFSVIGGLLLLKFVLTYNGTSKRRLVILALVIAGSASLALPLSYRFKEIASPDLSVIHQDSFTTDTYFDGLTLRLIQLRFAGEILTENEAWLRGVGEVNSQTALNQKYRDYNMFLGTKDGTDKGYEAYNFHNQWAEITVGIGLIGTILLLLMFIVPLFNANFFWPFASVVIVLFLFTLTESYLERQQGIVPFVILFSMLIKPSILSNDASQG